MIRRRHIQIDIGFDVKDRERLIQKASVLSCGDDERLHRLVDIVLAFESLNNGRDLDGFRSGTKNNSYFHWVNIIPIPDE